jgi:hypothetical protein
MTRIAAVYSFAGAVERGTRRMALVPSALAEHVPQRRRLTPGTIAIQHSHL